jgi:hypothetical protein
MGNINDFVCDNYYCQSISYKPEWFSESSWIIEYNDVEKKPYVIDKGVLKIQQFEKFNLMLSKKLLIDFDEIKNILIPINFRYTLKKNNEFNIFIIFTNKLLSINDINDLNQKNDDIFYINLILTKNEIFIYKSYDNKIINKKIKSKKINTFSINIENNFKLLLLTEKLFNNINNFYEEKYINMFNFNENKDFYLSIYIKNKENLLKDEFVELNFE